MSERHWIADAPTSLHGNGAGSFERTTRKVSEVTCRLCLSLLQKVSEYPCETCGGPVLEDSVVCLRDNERTPPVPLDEKVGAGT